MATLASRRRSEASRTSSCGYRARAREFAGSVGEGGGIGGCSGGWQKANSTTVAAPATLLMKTRLKMTSTRMHAVRRSRGGTTGAVTGLTR